SISWKIDQAVAQNSLVSASTAPEPAAGSATRAKFDSSRSTRWVLRATRRAKGSGRPGGAVGGSPGLASAPPNPAAATAMVVRNVFTYGSRRVIIRHAVSAVSRTG